MRFTRAHRAAGACALAATSALLLALAASARPASGWSTVGTLTASGQVTFASPGMQIAPDGGGAIGYEVYPDTETTSIATFSGSSGRLHSTTLRPALQAGVSTVAALDGGRAAIGGLEGGLASGGFALQFVGPGSTASRAQVPGVRQGLQAPFAVMAGNGREIAVLGASGGKPPFDQAALSGASPVLTLCTPAGGCGRTVALAPAGDMSVDGVEAQGSGLAVAVGGGGRVVAAWVRDGMLEARWRSAGGRLGPLQKIAAVHAQVWIALALSAQDRAALVWESQDVPNTVRPGPTTSATSVGAASAPAGGTFGRPLTLDGYPATAGSHAGGGARDATLSEPPVVAVTFDGTRPIAAWTGHDDAGFLVRSADLDDLAGTEQTLSARGASATLGALAAAPGRGLVIAWLSCTENRQHVCFPELPWAAQAPSDGRFGRPALLSGPDDGATLFSPALAAAIDPASGRPFVAEAYESTLVLFSGATAK